MQTRLGLKTYLNDYHSMNNGIQRIFQPFIETNWIHNTRNFGASMNGVAINQNGSRNIGELKTGVKDRLTLHCQSGATLLSRLAMTDTVTHRPCYL